MKVEPFVSIIFLTYKQASYVEEGLSSVLNQNYKNFEVIISDDCSPDSTFEICKNYCNQNYTNINVKFNKNENNLGIGGNLNKAMQLAEGEYFILAAGDDISLPDRVKTTVSHLISSDKNVKGVFTNLAKIDKYGVDLGLYFKKKPFFATNLSDFKGGTPCWCVGASLAFHRSIYDKFNKFLRNTKQEDGCIAFRAILLGTLDYNDGVTVCYRHHDDNISQNLSLKDKINFVSNRYILLSNNIKDYYISEIDDENLHDKLIKKLYLSNYEKTILKNKILSVPYYILTRTFLKIIRS